MTVIGKIAPQLLKILPDALGYRLLLSLTGATQPVPLSVPEQQALSASRPVRFGADGANTAWEWGTGPLVILIHGWGGRAAQMAPLAASLAAQGYRCVAPDITGHGDASKQHTRWSYFLRDIEALTRALRSDVFAFVGHSAGGMTMMAVRRHRRIKARCYVCICAPSYPFPPLNRVRQLLNPGDGVMERYKDYLGREFDISWPVLERGESYAAAGADLLLVYDERDRFVPHSEGDRIHALCPGSTLIKTRDYSHQRILTAPELPDHIGRFFAGHQAGAQMQDRAGSAR
jgi:pimeloyl-ACP methyl ester carboxylesterase